MLADPYVQVLGQITPGNKIECPGLCSPVVELNSPQLSLLDLFPNGLNTPKRVVFKEETRWVHWLF